jgi:hypothetical protein
LRLPNSSFSGGGLWFGCGRQVLNVPTVSPISLFRKLLLFPNRSALLKTCCPFRFL